MFAMMKSMSCFSAIITKIKGINSIKIDKMGDIIAEQEIDNSDESDI